MLLAIDVGNSSTVFGIDDGAGLWANRWRVSTALTELGNDWAAPITALAARDSVDLGQIQAVCICSVVPTATRALTEFSREWLRAEPMQINSKLRLNISLAMENPHEVGADRIANAAAAWDRCRSACVVVDLGTATKVEAINSGGEFAGGSIAPGIGVSMDALTARAARLFTIDSESTETAIGRNTVEAMQAGIVRGHHHMVSGLIADIRRELGTEAPVLITGGYASRTKLPVVSLATHEPDLTLNGIRLLHNLNAS